jgi:ssDNA-binding Zn-finger/Zn-ribbon topoisomerase 1
MYCSVCEKLTQIKKVDNFKKTTEYVIHFGPCSKCGGKTVVARNATKLKFKRWLERRPLYALDPLRG